MYDEAQELCSSPRLLKCLKYQLHGGWCLINSALQVLLCLQVMSHIIERSGISDMQRLQMQENITTFEDILGGSERLLRTPIPVSYTRHTSRFLLLWLTILPYALWAKLAWATVPAVGLIALLLLGT